MAYRYTNSRGTTYYLHARTRQLKSGKHQTLYFFSKTPKGDTLEKVPEGFEVAETRSGLPVLKRSGTHGHGGGP